MSYCEEADLLTGKLPLPPYVDVAVSIQNAADEMDAMIGFRYTTPVEIAAPVSPANRPTVLMLKRVNAHLASGRIIMAADTSGQDEQLHAYGLYLIKSATKVLDLIRDGEVDLPGALPLPGTDNQPTAPHIINVDEESLVEAWQDLFQNPLLPPRPLVW